MIEMLGVLAIIGVLSVGGIAGYSKAMMKYRVNKTIDQITTLSTNITTLFGNQNDFSGYGQNVLIKAKAIPEEMIQYNDNGTVKYIKHALGGGVRTINGVAKYKSVNKAQAIWIHFLGIPQDACITLATQNWENDDLIYMQINYISGGMYIDDCTSSVTDGRATQCAKDGPMNVYDATKSCRDGNTNTILWVFE